MTTNYSYRIGPDIFRTGFATVSIMIGVMMLRFNNWRDWTDSGTYLMAFACLIEIGLGVVLYKYYTWPFIRCCGRERFCFDEDGFAYNNRRYSYSSIKNIDSTWASTNYLLWGLIDRGKAQSVYLCVTFDDLKTISFDIDETTMFIGIYFRKADSISILRAVTDEFMKRSFYVRLKKYMDIRKPDGTLDCLWSLPSSRDRDVINYIRNPSAGERPEGG